MKAHVYRMVWCAVAMLVALPVAGVLTGTVPTCRWPVTYLVVQSSFRHLQVRQIRARVLPYLEKGFFALDLDAVQRAVTALPWAASVEVTRRWPDTLLLRVHEHEPFARWNNTQLIGRQGGLFRVHDTASYASLPALHGPDGHLSEVIEFYTRVRKLLTDSSLKIARLSLGDSGNWVLTTVTGTQLVLGDRSLAQWRLRRFLTVYPQVVSGHGGHFVYADLRYTNGFAVKWPPLARVDHLRL